VKCLVLLLAALIASSATAQQAVPSPPRYAMPATHVWDMKSDTGKTYRIMVSYPETEAPATDVPVLYVLDGNASFAAFAETRRVQEWQQVGKAIVVGVGYPVDQPYAEARNEDFIVMDKPPPGKRLGRTGGKTGRDAFLDFLTGKLRAEIATRYKTNPDRQSLFGHSFGGLFALHALYTQPQAFHSLIVASPSLELDEGVLRDERDFTARLTGGKVGKTSRLMVITGERDVDDDPEPARAFAARMEQLSSYGLRTRYRSYEVEGHMSVPARSVTDVLRFVFEQR
jgi:predicted alpha/beta superfamily hydrolase